MQIKTSTRDGRDGERIAIKRQLQHPDYNKTGNHDLDFGLIELVSAIEFDERARAIPLIRNDYEYDEGTTVEITGYGRLNTMDYNASYDLRLIRVSLNSWEECKQIYNGMTKAMLCAGINTLKDSCEGDSGGSMDIVVHW